MKLAVSHSEETPVLRKRSHSGGRGSVRPADSYFRVPYKDLDQVLKHMKRLYNQYKADPRIRKKAVEITAGIPKDSRTGIANRRDYDAIASAIYDWMKKKIAYVRDPAGVEYLQSPVKTLKYGFGDCDDLTTLGAALMSSVGLPVRFALAKTNPQNRDAYSHIYIEYEANGEWKAFDPTLAASAGTGLAGPMVFGKTSVPLDDCRSCKQNLGLVGIDKILGGNKSVPEPHLPETTNWTDKMSKELFYGLLGTALMFPVGVFTYNKLR